MRISTNGRYGLRVMLDLACNKGTTPQLRQEIAERQEISAEYIAHLFQRLTRAGLAKGVKGPGGGYLLAKEPGQIRVGDIFRAVEGPVAAVFCVLPNGLGTCKRRSTCAANVLWSRLSSVIETYLDSVTLADLSECVYQLDTGGGIKCLDTIIPFEKTFDGLDFARVCEPEWMI
jgi:Rrf2 family protein